MSAILETHIQLDEKGRPWITDATTRVIEVVLDKVAGGLEPDQIHAEYPHLSLSLIHSALAYYYDHKEEIDREIEEQVKEVRALAEQAKDTPGRRILRELGLL